MEYNPVEYDVALLDATLATARYWLLCHAKRNGELARWVLLKPAATWHWPTLRPVGPHKDHGQISVTRGRAQLPLLRMCSMQPFREPPDRGCCPNSLSMWQQTLRICKLGRSTSRFQNSQLYMCVSRPPSIACTSVLASTFKIWPLWRSWQPLLAYACGSTTEPSCFSHPSRLDTSLEIPPAQGS